MSYADYELLETYTTQKSGEDERIFGLFLFV